MIQSVLDPGGPEAARILQLAVALFVGAAVIFGLVCIAVIAALYGPRRMREALASRRFVIGAGIMFPVVTLSALLVYGLWVMRASIAEARAPADVRIEVSGEQWWWRVAYVTREGTRIEEANELRLPVGREVEINLSSPDVIHSFWIPALGGKIDMIPGRTNVMRVKAEREGVYRGQCAEYCGGPHALMAFDVIALDAGAFDAWLAAAKNGPSRPEAAASGRDLFNASGCGACHAIRGTEAAGRIGPDLSRVGGRRTIAAGTLPTNAGNIARFISDAQHVKPGNLMPPFRIFSDEERMAIAEFLMSLR